MNSTSATGTPARRAMARPSAVASAGLVVTANSWPAPPVASTVWVARTSTRRPSALRATTPRHRPPSHHQVEGEPLLQHGGGRGPGGVDQGPLDLGPGGRPAGVDHPGRRVAALAGQGQGPAGLAVEDGAHGDQLVDPGRALVDQHPHGVGVAQAGPGGQGVGQVEVGRVLVPAENGRHAALGPSGGRLGQLGLGQHADAQPVGRCPGPGRGRRGGQPDRGRQTGHAAPEDQHVEGDGRHLGIGPGGRCYVRVGHGPVSGPDAGRGCRSAAPGRRWPPRSAAGGAR